MYPWSQQFRGEAAGVGPPAGADAVSTSVAVTSLSARAWLEIRRSGSHWQVDLPLRSTQSKVVQMVRLSFSGGAVKLDRVCV